MPVLPPLPTDDLDHVLHYARAAFEQLRGRKIFITGGTGFFGHWLLESFCHANDRLGLQAQATVLSRDPASFAKHSPHLASRPELTFHAGDVRDFIFPEGQFSHVIHAGTTSGSPVEHLNMFDIITQGTIRTLDFAATHGAQRFLFVSSGAVYGKQPSEMTHISEDYTGGHDSLLPASAYGVGKRAGELHSVLLAQKCAFTASVARCFAFVGPRLPLDAHFAIGNFMRDAMAGRDIEIGGDGQPFRSYLHTADLAVWLWTILCRGENGRAYNVGSDQDIRIADLAHEVAQAAEAPNLNIKIAKTSTLGQPRVAYVPETKRAETELGLRVHIPLADAIRRTLAWHRQIPA